MPQKGVSKGGGKVKSAGALRRQVGKTRPGMRSVAAKKNKHVQIRALNKKFESQKRVDIENQIAAKTSGFQKFLVVKPEEEEKKEDTKKLKKFTYKSGVSGKAKAGSTIQQEKKKRK
ncbi:hypothetical protein SARC_09290 [Sphaeroforma arctica JP610]|uniref:Uncharacterized protein n=1 Tax=Sphaeroforma arctica JP610 TaxID=667725 RepID=A0A0L0FP45_9EUKA|nr:hypothetical protein SARC_09290 [Sphaeroforma arctica JP610]KNC78271.1 hypothetical protein SARC_09290 [Sphaeroforma arctica JP610]|eukprot:XP_014152173.1 hypothetical protein SARC_09290 [Sphaeroforma arctica JP610]